MLYSACPEQEMQILLAVVTFLSECVVQHASFMLLALGQHSPQWVNKFFGLNLYQFDVLLYGGPECSHFSQITA